MNRKDRRRKFVLTKSGLAALSNDTQMRPETRLLMLIIKDAPDAKAGHHEELLIQALMEYGGDPQRALDAYLAREFGFEKIK